MQYRIRRIDPMQAAKMATVLYLVLGLILVPIFMLASMAAPTGTGFGIGFSILVPFIYAAFGFVFTLIGAALYNLVAGWVGGIELELEGPAQA